MLNGEQTVATRLRALRERRGWSQNQLASRAEIGNSTISRIEAGVIASPGVEVLRRLSGALGVDLSEITGERPMPRRQTQIFEGGAAVPVWRRRVHAGGQAYWDDTTETMWVSRTLVAAHPKAACAVVTGDCMAPHVLAGEKVVFDPDQAPGDRDMVVVTDDEGDTMIKWYRVDPLGRPYLRAADGTEIRPNGARVEGVVLAVERRALRDPGP